MPQLWHWLFGPQMRLLLHGLDDGQQVWFSPPHGWHMPPVQMAPAAVHVFCEQHGWPTPPQATQSFIWHATPGAVHANPPQHACWAPPQLPQLPFWHVPLTWAQVAPAPTQRFAMQQPPFAHALPEQHGSPGPPHGPQTSRPMRHDRPAPAQVRPGQHEVPTSPHTRHRPARQLVFPAMQTLPAQHGCPGPPQRTHWLFAHVVPGAVQSSPLQHAWFSPPHVPHAPLMHMPSEPPQPMPSGRHAPFTQQPPLVHELPAQHSWSAAPHRPPSGSDVEKPPAVPPPAPPPPPVPPASIDTVNCGQAASSSSARDETLGSAMRPLMCRAGPPPSSCFSVACGMRGPACGSLGLDRPPAFGCDSGDHVASW